MRGTVDSVHLSVAILKPMAASMADLEFTANVLRLAPDRLMLAAFDIQHDDKALPHERLEPRLFQKLTPAIIPHFPMLQPHHHTPKPVPSLKLFRSL